MRTFVRAMVASFAGRLLAVLFVAVCVLLGFGPDQWAAFLISGLPIWITPSAARITLLLAAIVIVMEVISLRRPSVPVAESPGEAVRITAPIRSRDEDPLIKSILEARARSDRVLLGLEIDPLGLQIEIGESGKFASTTGTPYRTRRTLSVKIENRDSRRFVSCCKLYLTKIEPQTEYVGPWLLADGFALAAGDHLFVPLVTYGEARDISKFPCGDTFMVLHAIDSTEPKPSAGGEHVLTLRATSMETAPCEFKCTVWVDDGGRLRIRDQNLNGPEG
jgi:hypothetical protein